MTFKIDRLTEFERNGTRLAVTYSIYDGEVLIAQNKSINITLDEITDINIQELIIALNEFAITKIKEVE